MNDEITKCIEDYILSNIRQLAWKDGSLREPAVHDFSAVLATKLETWFEINPKPQLTNQYKGDV